MLINSFFFFFFFFVGILTFMSMINFVLSLVEHEKGFITSGTCTSMVVSIIMKSLN